MTHNVTSLSVRTSIILPRGVLHKTRLSLTRRTECKSLAIKEEREKTLTRWGGHAVKTREGYAMRDLSGDLSLLGKYIH